MNAHTPAMRQTVEDVVKEYEKKAGAIPAALSHFKQATADLEASASIGGQYAGSIWYDGRYYSAPDPNEKTLRDKLRKSAWRHVYKLLNIDRIATAQDRKRFELAMENPPELTFDNAVATFGEYVVNKRHHYLRGLAECFVDLDPAYKSHSKVKIGVEGLPKRIILTSCGDWGSWGYERLRDTLNALNVYREKPHIKHKELSQLLEDASEHGAGWYDGIEIRRFQNGNVHLIFEPETLREINLALAEFYGDTLPDSPEDVQRKRPGTEVSKNLAYYPTPREVVSQVLNRLDLRHVETALEPSCGCGRILDALEAEARHIAVTGVEYDAARAMECRVKGHHVMRANFLQVAPNPRFDLVVMNPPFNGREWRKHLDHARKFLKPDGRLACILPASAYYDGHLDDLKPKSTWADFWFDLPVASFAASGTNIPTGFVVM